MGLVPSLSRVLLLAVCALAAGAPAEPAAAGSRCTAAKYKAAGRYLDGLAKCQAKATAKGSELDVLCIAKAQSNLASAFAKAEAKGDCLTVGDVVPVEDVLSDPAGESFEILLPPPTRRCCQNGGGCFWTDDVTECDAPGVTVGEVGSVCNGETRACVPPPPVGSGLCCEGVSLPALAQTTCVGKPMLTCGLLGGTEVPDSVCHASKRCLP